MFIHQVSHTLRLRNKLTTPPLMFHFGEEDTNPSLEDMRTLDFFARHLRGVQVT
jgi:hypothetical protein